jgi:acetyl-CoA acetyltransferase
MIDYQGAFADTNPIDFGIKGARAVLERTGLPASRVDSVLAGNVAPGGFDQFHVPRHIGLYAGVPMEVPALMVQRICGTGFKLFRQAGEQRAAGVATTVLLVGTESMTRNPMAAFDHRDTHPRPTSPEVLATLGTVFDDDVQTGGNRSALTDAAAAAVVVKAIGARWGVAPACEGGGQGIALLVENAEASA